MAVSYAVLSFGRLWGIKSGYYPLLWAKLTYDENLGGFWVEVTKEQIQQAPHYAENADVDWSPQRGREVYDDYGMPPYWI